MPFPPITGGNQWDHRLQKRFDVGVHRHVGELVLVDLRGVDLDVNDPAMLGKLTELAGDPIVKSNAQGQEKVGLVDGIIRVDRAVHAEHIERQIMVARNRPQTVHRHRDRNAGLGGEIAQLPRGARRHHSSAAIDDWPRAALDRRENLLDSLGRRGRRNPVSGQRHGDIVIGIRNHGVLDVLGNVDQHRPRSAGPGKMERFLDNPGNISRILNKIMMLGDRPRDLDHRRFLKRIGTNDMGRHLAGDRHERD